MLDLYCAVNSLKYRHSSLYRLLLPTDRKIEGMPLVFYFCRLSDTMYKYTDAIYPQQGTMILNSGADERFPDISTVDDGCLKDSQSLETESLPA